MGLRSEFLTIGTEGDTVDGRAINKQWLVEAAQGYNVRRFAAVVNLNHWDPRYYGSYGKVVAVRKGVNEEGKTTLEASIEPNDKLIALSRAEVLFTSMELGLNFQGQGKAYLEGLAVTPKPASVGTEQVQFACEPPANANEDRVYGNYLRTQFAFTESPGAADGEDERLFERFKRLFSTPQTASSAATQDIDMTKEELTAMLAENNQTLLAQFTQSQVGQLSPQAPAVTTTQTTEHASQLLLSQGYSVSKPASDDEVKAAMATLQAQGFSVTKPASEDEVKAARLLLEQQGLTVSDKPEPAPGAGKVEFQGKEVTREELDALKTQLDAAITQAANFTQAEDFTGQDNDTDYL